MLWPHETISADEADEKVLPRLACGAATDRPRPWLMNMVRQKAQLHGRDQPAQVIWGVFDVCPASVASDLRGIMSKISITTYQDGEAGGQYSGMPLALLYLANHGPSATPYSGKITMLKAGCFVYDRIDCA